MNIGYILQEMTYLRYFLPLVEESKRRGHRTIFFTPSSPSIKYNCPHKHRKYLEECCKKFGVELCTINDVNMLNDCQWIFTIEGAGIEILPSKSRVVSLTALRDFAISYDKYADRVHTVVFISQFLAEKYGKTFANNIYVGSPKYDITLDKTALITQYGIKSAKNALVVFPELSHLPMLDMPKIYSVLHEMGYNIMVKSRAKHSAPKEFRGDMYYEDFKWFPHVSMELETMSDLAIVFDSTATKEFVMLDLPFINFEVAAYDAFDFLHQNSFCRNLVPSFEKQQLQNAIEELSSSSHKEAFQKARKDFLFDDKLCSARLLDYVEKNK